jgi:hypothetical protein
MCTKCVPNVYLHMNDLSLLGLLPPGPSSSRARASLMRDREGERGEGGGGGQTDKGGSEDSDTRVVGISYLSPGSCVGPGVGVWGASHDSPGHASQVCCYVLLMCC